MATAIIPLASLNVAILTNNMTVVVTTVDINGNLVTLCTLTGNFAGFTLNQFIIAVVACINSGGIGFTAIVSGTNIIVSTILTGYVLAGALITLSLPPSYILLWEEDSTDNYNLGFSHEIPGKISFADIAGNSDLLYVPNTDSATSAPDSTVTKSFDGATIGNIINITAGVEWTILPDGLGLSTALYAVGNSFQLAVNVLGVDYRVVGIISGTGYNAGTGALQFTITNLLQAGAVTSPFSIPPGLRTWGFTFLVPGFGSINLYNVNSDPASPSFGDITFNATIVTPISDPKDSFYIASTNSVYVLCCAVNQSTACAGVVRINVATPAVIAQTLNTALQNAQSMYYYPPYGRFYINSQNSVISKVDLALGYNAAANISPGNNYGSMVAMTYNPANGNIYYAPYFSLPAPNAVYIIIPQAAIGTIDTFGTTLVTFTDSISHVCSDGLYFEPTTNRLFVLRGNGTFQSYDISSGVSATIDSTRTNYTLPNGDTAGGNMSYQSGANRIFINTAGSSRIYIFDPITETFDASYVDQPNLVNIFSFTNDGINLNYFAVGGGAVPQTLSVIHAISAGDQFSGIFLDEAVNDGNCPFCYEYPLIACYDNYVFDLDLSPDTVYNITLTDKFQKKYRQQVTSDADGKIMIDPAPFPDGFFTPENGNLTMEITDANNIPVAIVIGYTLYTCLTLTFEYNNLYD